SRTLANLACAGTGPTPSSVGPVPNFGTAAVLRGVHALGERAVLELGLVRQIRGHGRVILTAERQRAHESEPFESGRVHHDEGRTGDDATTRRAAWLPQAGLRTRAMARETWRYCSSSRES